MQRVIEIIKEKAGKLLADGTVDRVIGWKDGEFFYDPTPAVFSAGELENLRYDSFCGANVSKYLIAETKDVYKRQGGTYRLHNQQVRVKSTVGAGDTTLAAFLAALQKGESAADAVRYLSLIHI